MVYNVCHLACLEVLKSLSVSRRCILTASSFVILAFALLASLSCGADFSSSNSSSRDGDVAAVEPVVDDQNGAQGDDTKAIYASYHGSTAPGAVIDDNSDFELFGYDNGIKVAYPDWSLSNPGMLPDAGVATYDIECEGQTVVARIRVHQENTAPSVGASLYSSSHHGELVNPNPGYEMVDIREIHAMAERPYGKRIRFSFMVEHIYEGSGSTEVVYGYSGTDPCAIFVMNSELGKQVNDHTEITVEGVVAESDISPHAGQHTLCVRVQNMVIDSRDKEQFVKPNQISEARR